VRWSARLPTKHSGDRWGLGWAGLVIGVLGVPALLALAPAGKSSHAWKKYTSMAGDWRSRWVWGHHRGFCLACFRRFRQPDASYATI